MSYKATSDSCTLSEAERLTESQTLVNMIQESVDELTHYEREFVMKMDGATFCTIKQLFWLRDIKDKYL